MIIESQSLQQRDVLKYSKGLQHYIIMFKFEVKPKIASTDVGIPGCYFWLFYFKSEFYLTK